MSRFADALKNAATVHKDVRPLPSVIAPAGITWSKDQEAFLAAHGNSLVLTALAGSGKTSVLIEYARRRPHQRWNFVVFNRSVADDVSARAPKNMVVKTAHQMAYAQFGHDLHHKIKETFSLTQINALSPRIPRKAQKDFSILVRKILTEYLNSADVIVTENLVNSFEWESFQEKYSGDCWSTEDLLETVRQAWRLSLDPASDFQITHDVYLKRFSMVQDQWRGSYWMLDEAQDWSDAFLHCWKRSTECAVRAGDPFQKLYEWRGASSQKWCDLSQEKEFWLTHSFRTGQSPEPWVNARLKALGCKKTWSSALPSVCTPTLTPETAFEIQTFRPAVVLATRWEDLERLSEQLKQEKVEHTLGLNALPLASTQAPILTTIHSVKGLEFERVWIADSALPVDEHAVQKNRLAYVALTRAQKSVRIPSHWPQVLQSPSLFDDF